MRRTISIVVAVALVVAVGATIIVARRHDHRTAVRAAVDSEAAAYFNDPAVKAELAKRGYSVTLDVVPSSAVATNAAGDDFAIAAGPFASHLSGTPVFSSPMVVVARVPAADALVKLGAARRAGPYWMLNLTKVVQLAGAGVPLAGNRLVIGTTDLATSNAAAAFVAAASTAANGGHVLRSAGAADNVLNPLTRLLSNGGPAPSTAALWTSLLKPGTKVSIIWTYEAQFAAAAADHGASGLAMLYPAPGIVSPVTVSERTRNGAAVRALLTDDPALQDLAARHGYRTASSAFNEFATASGVPFTPSPPAARSPSPATLDLVRNDLEIAWQHAQKTGRP